MRCVYPGNGVTGEGSGGRHLDLASSQHCTLQRSHRPDVVTDEAIGVRDRALADGDAFSGRNDARERKSPRVPADAPTLLSERTRPRRESRLSNEPNPPRNGAGLGGHWADCLDFERAFSRATDTQSVAWEMWVGVVHSPTPKRGGLRGFIRHPPGGVFADAPTHLSGVGAGRTLVGVPFRSTPLTLNRHQQGADVRPGKRGPDV